MNNKDDDMSSEDDSIDTTSEELVQCSLCLRRMRREVFIKHPNVCRKNPTNKRNAQVFDISQYRSIRAGDKIIPVRKTSPINANKPNNIISRPSQTRSAKRDRRSDTLVPPVIDNFCCPTCKRTFCEKAYDRHVAFCTSKTKQIQQPPSEETLLARLKLDRRIKFGSNRIFSITSKTPSSLISTPISNKESTKLNPPTYSSQTISLLPLRKKLPISLAHCPWCSKPYIPNCTHYCRNVKEFYSIYS